ncbi:MAG: hypothetical protein Q9191_002020 [Dirinaria sp. TL-2023a]
MDLWKILNPSEQDLSCSNSNHASPNNAVDAFAAASTSSRFAEIDTANGLGARSTAFQYHNEPFVPLPSLRRDTPSQNNLKSTPPPFAAVNTSGNTIDGLSEPSSLEISRLGRDPFTTQASMTRSGAPAVIAAIESMFFKIGDSLGKQEELSIEIKRLLATGRVAVSEIRFPGRNAQEAWRFSTQNLYYKDPSLFKSQQIVDRSIDILAFTIGVRRDALNVTAAAKGLVVGGFSLITENRHVTRHEHDAEAKGYPDIATRKLLRLLATSDALPPRVFALADFDPDGIAIIGNFKHGSRTLSHENAALNVSSVEWLGLRSCALLERRVDDASEGLLRLSYRDRKKAMKILENPQLSEGAAEKEWRRELQVMLMLGVKAEMEIMSDRADGLERWVDERLLEELHFQGDTMQS